MTRIIVLSDTHVPELAETLPTQVLEAVKKSDICLHAGDFVEYSVFKELSKLAETHGVCGNMDSMDIRKKLPQKEIIQVEEVKIALAHGRGSPDAVPAYIEELFKDEFETIDLFVYGHSHKAGKIKRQDKLFFNPGSVCDTVYAAYRSYGIIEVNGRHIATQVVRLD